MRNKPLIKPAPLEKGDRVAILSPASIIKPQNVFSALHVLHRQGWVPYIGNSALNRYGTYAGTDDERYGDLEAAFLDPTTKAIFCSRGGYGVVHLLERLNRLPLRENPKWLVGFSDISALHALLSSHGIASLHAPMTSHFTSFGGEDEDAGALFDLLRGGNVHYRIPAHEYNRTGKVVAPLVGGNLAVLTGLIKTPFDLFMPGTVLFIEDVSEPVYKIERMMYQLRLSGVLSQLSGLIVGRFTEYVPDVDNASMEAMIRNMVEPYNYPVAFNVPVGHVDHNIPLIESAQVTLSVETDYVIIEQ